jgi:hypothetical protein
MPCPNSNNPSGLRCSQGKGRFAQVGRIFEWTVTHNKKEKVTLNFGTKSLDLLIRSKQSKYTTEDEHKWTDSISCQMSSGSGNFYQYQTQANVIKATRRLEDKVETVDRFIQYLDLRNDFILYKEKTNSLDRNDNSKGQVLWNQYGATTWLYKFIPDDSKIDVVFTNAPMINATQTSKAVVESTRAYGLPPTGGTPQNNEPEDYWIWNIDTAKEVGGYDLYHPEWLDGVSDRPEYDIEDKDFRWNIIQSEESNPSGNISLNITLTEPYIEASAAHDTLDNYFVALKDVNGNSRIKLSDLSEEATEILLQQNKEIASIGVL